MQMPGRRKRGTQKKRFLDDVKEDMQGQGQGEKDGDDPLWGPLTGAAKRRKNPETELVSSQPPFCFVFPMYSSITARDAET